MKLFGVHLSPFFERAYIVMDAKGATDQIEISMVPGGFGSPEHVAHNPAAKIPYLVLDDGRVLTEGQVIAEYLNDTVDGVSLIPADPFDAARTKQLCRLVDLDLSAAIRPFAQALIFNNKDDAAITRSVSDLLPKALDTIEYFLGDDFAVGDSFTLADAALVTASFQIDKLGSHFGAAGFGDRPKLSAWLTKMQDHALATSAWARMQAVLDMVAARQAAARKT